ncbi:cytochrome c [Erythrobacter alti]|uniref:cytochrome c n=1 Tax=Erythrobacter alti TaxID=1896145 RepID=UPI0030F3D163
MADRARWKRWAQRGGIALLALAVVALAGAAWIFRPLPLEGSPKLETSAASAERGEYLAQIGNCSACHTVPGGEELAGGVAFHTDFGTIYSTNITPDRENGIGNWTFSQFHRAMKHGIGDGGEHLYPAFPYTSFAQMTDQDIGSLYLHLARTPAIATANRDNDMDFPFGNRGLLHFWKRLFHEPEQFQANASQAPEWNRGAYLVEAVAHCGACHTPRNALGGPDNDRHLQGGIYVDQVRNGAYRRWAAVDITPGENGLAHWSAEDFEQYLAEGQNAHAVVHGPMNEVFASTGLLTDEDRLAMAIYLTGVAPSSPRWRLPFPSLGASDGEIVYTVHCGTCHLPDGGGDPTLGVSLHNNPVIQAEDPSSLINVILYGPDLPPPPFTVGRSRMKAFGRRLSDDDIAAVATYLRSSFGNNASGVSASQVARQR